jgi:hypothetical protein
VRRLAKLGIRLVRAVRARSVGRLRRPLVAVARRGRDGLRAARGVRRAAWLILFALWHREELATRRTNVVASVGGPVTQEVLRNMVAWQLGIRRDATLGVRGRLCVAEDAAAVQLDRLLSLLCLSATFGSFDIVFGEPQTAPGRDGAPPTDRPEPPAEWPRFDLSTPHGLALGGVDTERLREAFVPSLDGRRTATSYLKIAHPRAFVVALSLVEDDDGFADEALAKWLPHVRRFRLEMPGVAFCLLNRTLLLTHDHEDPPGADVSPVRGLGFGLADAVALAQMADAFVGVVDAFGLAAVAAQRPGVYVDRAPADRARAAGATWLLADASPEQCLDALAALVREQRIDRRQAARPASGGPATA